MFKNFFINKYNQTGIQIFIGSYLFSFVILSIDFLFNKRIFFIKTVDLGEYISITLIHVVLCLFAAICYRFVLALYADYNFSTRDIFLIVFVSFFSIFFFPSPENPNGVQMLVTSPSNYQTPLSLLVLVYVLGSYLIIPFLIIKKNQHDLIKCMDQAWTLFG